MLAKKLSELRKAKKKTQDDIANFLGITRPAYTAYESGRRTPDYDTLKKLADYFDTTTDYLLDRTDDPTPPYKKIETIAAHRSDDPLSELPEPARKSLEAFLKAMYEKYGKDYRE
jgi:transcriptional regulator with XRE-family HTH domain